MYIFFINSGLNPRGALDFSPLYIFSKGLFKWQVMASITIYGYIDILSLILLILRFE